MKRTLIVLTLVAIMFGMAAATETRMTTFGLSSTFFSDYTNIYTRPANAVNYPRLIAAEMGASFPVPSDYGWSRGSAALLFSNAEQSFGVVGFDINHDVNGSAFLANAAGSFGIPTPDNRFHVFYAKKLDNLTAGLHIGWAGASGDSTSTDTANAYTFKTEGSSNLWLINGEVMMTVDENTSAELAVGLKMESFKGTQSENWRDPTIAPPPSINYEQGVESDGGMGLDVELRANYGMSENLKLIPVLGFSTNSIGYKTTGNWTGFVAEGGKKSASSFGGAFGCNYKPMENVAIVGGFLIGSDKQTVEDTTAVFSLLPGASNKEEISTFTLPGFCAGLEVDLLKWLTLRAGAAKTMVKTTEKFERTATTYENNFTDAPYYYAFGVGFKFGKLLIDAKLNNNVPYSMGYFISGIDNGGMPGASHTEPITSVALTYTF